MEDTPCNLFILLVISARLARGLVPVFFGKETIHYGQRHMKAQNRANIFKEYKLDIH